jgi:hypothetical protein
LKSKFFDQLYLLATFKKLANRFLVQFSIRISIRVRVFFLAPKFFTVAVVANFAVIVSSIGDP